MSQQEEKRLLDQYKKKVWSDYHFYLNDLKNLKRENQKLQQAIQEEQIYRQEITRGYQQKIDLLEEQLQEAKQKQRFASSYVKQTTNNVDFETLFRKTDMIVQELDEEGKKLDAKTENIMKTALKEGHEDLLAKVTHSILFEQPSNSSLNSLNFGVSPSNFSLHQVSRSSFSPFSDQSPNSYTNCNHPESSLISSSSTKPISPPNSNICMNLQTSKPYDSTILKTKVPIPPGTSNYTSFSNQALGQAYSSLQNSSVNHENISEQLKYQNFSSNQKLSFPSDLKSPLSGVEKQNNPAILPTVTSFSASVGQDIYNQPTISIEQNSNHMNLNHNSETKSLNNFTSTNPIITNPVITNPVVTNPIVTNPVVTNPVVLNPVVSSSVVTNQNVNNSTLSSQPTNDVLGKGIKQNDDAFQKPANINSNVNDDLNINKGIPVNPSIPKGNSMEPIYNSFEHDSSDDYIFDDPKSAQKKTEFQFEHNSDSLISRNRPIPKKPSEIQLSKVPPLVHEIESNNVSSDESKEDLTNKEKTIEPQLQKIGIFSDIKVIQTNFNNDSSELSLQHPEEEEKLMHEWSQDSSKITDIISDFADPKIFHTISTATNNESSNDSVTRTQMNVGILQKENKNEQSQPTNQNNQKEMHDQLKDEGPVNLLANTSGSGDSSTDIGNMFDDNPFDDEAGEFN